MEPNNRDKQTKRKLRKAVRKILSTVRQVAELGDEARKVQQEFERLTKESEPARA